MGEGFSKAPTGGGMRAKHPRTSDPTGKIDVLDAPVEDLIGTHAKRAKAAGKRGPAPKIQQQLEQIEALPKAKQRAIAHVLDSMLAQSSG